MAKKKNSQRFVMFAARPKIAGRKVYPLSAGRLLLLQEKKNPIFLGVGEGEEVPSFRLFEILMVISLTSDELAELAVEDEKTWQTAVMKVQLETEEESAAELMDVVNEEINLMNAALSSPKKKGAKKAARRSPRTGG